MHSKKFYVLFFIFILILFLLSFSFYYHKFFKNTDKEVFIQDTNEIKDYIIETKEEFNPYMLDFYSDDSYYKYLSPNNSFENLKYKPNDLVVLDSKYILNVWWNQSLRKQAAENLYIMAEDFYSEFQVKLKVISSYRSYEHQALIKSRWCSDYFCAKPWHSEHQSGLAVDFFEATNKQSFLSKPDLMKYFEWLSKNAYKYGFHNTYQKWRDIDWYEIEPWHWRYLWVDFASYLYENNLTFAEFLSLKKED